MLKRAPLEIVPPYLRTLWRGLDICGLKSGGSTGRFPAPSVGLPRDKWKLLFIIFFFEKLLFLDIYCLTFRKFRTFLCELILHAGAHLVLICSYVAEYCISLGKRMVGQSGLLRGLLGPGTRNNSGPLSNQIQFFSRANFTAQDFQCILGRWIIV